MSPCSVLPLFLGVVPIHSESQLLHKLPLFFNDRYPSRNSGSTLVKNFNSAITPTIFASLIPLQACVHPTPSTDSPRPHFRVHPSPALPSATSSVTVTATQSLATVTMISSRILTPLLSVLPPPFYPPVSSFVSYFSAVRLSNALAASPSQPSSTTAVPSSV